MLRRLRRIIQPHADIAAALQSHFALPRQPACRTQHGRFEITVRGGGYSAQPTDECVALAEAIAAVARPWLEHSHRMLTRRAARSALRVTFEDERVVGNGVATTSVSYVALIRDTRDDTVERRLWHPSRWV